MRFAIRDSVPNTQVWLGRGVEACQNARDAMYLACWPRLACYRKADIGDAPEQFKLQYFVLIEICSVDIPVACLKINTGAYKGIPSERRIYESTLLGQTKLFS